MSDAEAIRPVDLEVRPPKQERSRAAWNRVLDAGVAILEDGGHDAFTIAAVCDRAGVAPTAIYARTTQQGRAVPGRLRARHRPAPRRAAGVRRRRAAGPGWRRPRWSGPRWPRWSGSRCAISAFLGAVVLISAAHEEVGPPRVLVRPGARGRLHPRGAPGRRRHHTPRSRDRDPRLLRLGLRLVDHPRGLRACLRDFVACGRRHVRGGPGRGGGALPVRSRTGVTNQAAPAGPCEWASGWTVLRSAPATE